MLIVFHCFLGAHNKEFEAQNTGPNVGSFLGYCSFFSFSCV